MTSPDDFRPAASREALHLRAALLRRLREFFHERGFLEVETPLLSADTVIDRHLDPLALTLFDDPRTPGVGRTFYLQTSPEFGMKRLLATGEYPAIYQITRAFRGGEIGPRHNPEFTMVEWYRVGDHLVAGMQLLSDLCDVALARGPAERLTYREAYLRYAGIDPLAASVDEFAQLCAQRNLSPPAGLDRDGWLNFLLVELVEPKLGGERPAIVYDWPATQSALAIVRHEDPPVAERFELYVDGVELANGYHELLDAGELRRRNERINRERSEDGKPALPEESRLLAAMQHGLPACSGTALGFDRLVMVAAGATSLAEVMALPIDRA